MLYNQQFR